MKTIKELIEIEFKTTFLIEVENFFKHLNKEYYERNVPIVQKHFENFLTTFNTSEFQEFISEQTKEINDYYELVKKYKKNRDNLNINKDEKNEFLIVVENISDNNTEEEKYELFQKREYLNKLVFFTEETQNTISPFIAEQFTSYSRRLLENDPTTLSDFFSQAIIFNPKDSVVIKSGALNYMNLIEKEHSRLPSIIKKGLLKLCEGKSLITRDEYINRIVKKILSLTINEQKKFIEPENTYCEKTLAFFNIAKSAIASNSKISKIFEKSNGEILDHANSFLNNTTASALLIQMNLSIDVKNNIYAFIKKLVEKNEEITLKDIRRKVIETPASAVEMENFIKLFHEEQDKVRRLTVLENLNDKNFETNLIKKTRVLNIDIEGFKKYFGIHQKNQNTLDNLNILMGNIHLANTFQRNKILAINLDLDEVSDNEILKEFYLTVEKLINDPKLYREINKYEIIKENNSSPEMKEVIVNFEARLRSQILLKMLEQSDIGQTRVKKKM